MFPAYNSIKTNDTQEIKHESEANQLNWLSNTSFQIVKEIEIIKVEKREKSEDVVVIQSSDQNSSSYDEPAKKKRKKKLKKRKHKHVKQDSSKLNLFNSNFFVIGDPDYLRAFEGMSKEQLSKELFINEIPNMSYKYAYRIDKRADKNNLCFDTNYHKHVPSYSIPFEYKLDAKSIKQRRNQQIESSRKHRYYISVLKLPNECEQLNVKSSNFHLSTNLKLYMELKMNEKNRQADILHDYNTYLNEHANDIDKWIEFVSSQDALSSERDVNHNQVSLYDRKFAIFERALKQNPNSFKLKLEHIKLKTRNFNFNEFTSHDKAENEYLNLIENECKQNNLKNTFETWCEYICSLINTNFSNVTTSKIRQVFVRAIEFFLKNENSFEQNDQFYDYLFSLISSYVRFMYSSGYDEKAYGLCQALVDFNTSSSTKLSFKSLKSLFELYYDSNLPKFSENYSIGWFEGLEKRDYLYKTLENTSFERHDDQIDCIEEEIISNDVFMKRIELKWLDIEYLRANAHWYPYYPYVTAGESADDVADTDRLIDFDEDINFALFNLQFNKKFDYFLIKMVALYFERFNFITFCDDLSKDLVQSEDDFDYFYTLTGVFELFDTKLRENYDFITQLFSTNKDYIIDFFIKNQRNAFDQLLHRSQTHSIKTFVTILKWKFELTILFACKRFKVTYTNQEHLLGLIKNDLAHIENRTNTQLWIEYAVLKYILYKTSLTTHDYVKTKESLSKELKKVFETLMRTNQTNLPKLCSIYLQLEFEVYFRSYDIVFNEHTIDYGLATDKYCDQDLVPNIEQPLLTLNESQKNYFIELILNCCLGNSINNEKSKVNVSSLTRLLISKRELADKYENITQNNPNSEELILFYKCYSFYLILNKDYVKFFEINDGSQEFEGKFLSEKLQFYIQLLNSLYYRQRTIDKQQYKVKFFNVLNHLIKKPHLISSSINALIQRSFLKLRLSSAKLFCSQLIESNDSELIMNSYANISTLHPKIKHSTHLTLIFVDMYKLVSILRQIKFESTQSSVNQSIVPVLGFHNQIRRRFDLALKHLPKSRILYQLYFQFEMKYLSETTNKIQYLYYQAVQNKPFSRALYLQSIQYLPHKLIEIVKVMEARDIRFRIPIQELDMLLDPIRNKNDCDVDKDEESDNREDSLNNKNI